MTMIRRTAVRNKPSPSWWPTWGRTYLLAFVGTLTIVLAACGAGRPSSDTDTDTSATVTSVEVDGGRYLNVESTDLNEMLAAKDFPLINVHIPYEGEIEGTDLFIPFDEIEQNLDQLPADKDAKVVLYCRSGNMSDIAARELVKLGYSNIWNLNGGMNSWEDSGFSLLQQP